MLTILAVALLVAAPAVVLRAFCVGHSCDEPTRASAEVPFCSLPEAVRDAVAAGYREGRSPDVMAVARGDLRGGTAWPDRGLDPPWPSLDGGAGGTVPIVFAGEGIAPGAELEGATLDRVAPTIAEVIGLDRAHPEVRSGTPFEGIATGTEPRLVIEVILKGAGNIERDAAGPALSRLAREGSSTFEGRPGSLPLEPAAILATIGTGGTPAQHGITGELLRNDQAELVGPSSPDAPLSVIATLADDLDENLDQEPLIGLVTTDIDDRVAIGGDWYIDVDRDDVRPIVDEGPEGLAAATREALLHGRYGRDGTSDLLVVTMTGYDERVDGALGRIVSAAREATEGSAAVVVTATGAAAERPGNPDAVRAIRRQLKTIPGGSDLIEAVVPGGVFTDQDTLTERQISEDEVVSALRKIRDETGRPLLADAFPAIAVSFARYC